MPPGRSNDARKKRRARRCGAAAQFRSRGGPQSRSYCGRRRWQVLVEAVDEGDQGRGRDSAAAADAHRVDGASGEQDVEAGAADADRKGSRPVDDASAQAEPVEKARAVASNVSQMVASALPKTHENLLGVRSLDKRRLIRCHQPTNHFSRPLRRNPARGKRFGRPRCWPRADPTGRPTRPLPPGSG
jgi:hypothetical protein